MPSEGSLANPFQEDFLQKIVSVNWGGGAYVLLFMDSIGTYNVNPYLFTDVNGNFISASTSVSMSGQMLYSNTQLYTITSEDQHWTVYYHDPTGAPGTTTVEFDFLGVHFVVRDPGGFEAFLAITPTEEAFGDSVLVAILGYHKTTFTATIPHYEAAYLFKVPPSVNDKYPSFTLTNSGIGLGMEMFLYPTLGIKVDAKNTSAKWFSGSRVFYPINWTKKPPPTPKAPNGRPWGGTNVIDAHIWRLTFNTVGVNTSIKMEVPRKSHLKEAPGTSGQVDTNFGITKTDPNSDNFDPNVADVIFEMYPVSGEWGDDNDHDRWSVVTYRDKPYGTQYSPPTEWPAPFLSAGPLPKVRIDT